MSQLNGNYSNSTNVAVLGTSAHETSEIQVFNSPIFGEIRVATDRNGNPLFCLVDICTSIGIVNHRNVKNRLDKDDVHMIDTLTNGGLQSMVYVTESGMYDVVLRSDSPKAKPFKKWVTGDVLPSIRKTGSYSLQPQYNVPQSFAEALQLAADQAKQIEEQQKQIEQKDAKIAKIQPKADFADKAFQAENSKVDISMSAKILGLPFGRNTLFKKLREAGVFFSNKNEPKQRYIDAKYFEMTEKYIERNEHPSFIVTKVLVTQKGLAYINHLFGGKPSDGKIIKIV